MECSFCFRRFLSFISFHVSSDSRFFPFYYFYNLWKYSNALLWRSNFCKLVLDRNTGIALRVLVFLLVIINFCGYVTLNRRQTALTCSQTRLYDFVILVAPFQWKLADCLTEKHCYSGLMLSVIISWIAHNSFWTLSNSRGSNSSTFTSTWSCTLTYLEWLMIVLQFRA